MSKSICTAQNSMSMLTVSLQQCFIYKIYKYVAFFVSHIGSQTRWLTFAC